MPLLIEGCEVIATRAAKGKNPARGEEGRALVRSALSARWDAAEFQRSGNSVVPHQTKKRADVDFTNRKRPGVRSANRSDHEEAPTRVNRGRDRSLGAIYSVRTNFKLVGWFQGNDTTVIFVIVLGTRLSREPRT